MRTKAFFYVILQKKDVDMGDSEQKIFSDEEILHSIKQGIFRIVSGYQSYSGPNGETYTKANLGDLERLEKYYERKVSAKKNSGGIKTMQVRFGR